MSPSGRMPLPRTCLSASSLSRRLLCLWCLSCGSPTPRELWVLCPGTVTSCLHQPSPWRPLRLAGCCRPLMDVSHGMCRSRQGITFQPRAPRPSRRWCGQSFDSREGTTRILTPRSAPVTRSALAVTMHGALASGGWPNRVGGAAMRTLTRLLRTTCSFWPTRVGGLARRTSTRLLSTICSCCFKTRRFSSSWRGTCRQLPLLAVGSLPRCCYSSCGTPHGVHPRGSSDIGPRPRNFLQRV